MNSRTVTNHEAIKDDEEIIWPDTILFQQQTPYGYTFLELFCSAGPRAFAFESSHSLFLSVKKKGLVHQSKDGSSYKASWFLERVEGNKVLIKTSSNHYLTITNVCLRPGLPYYRVEHREIDKVKKPTVWELIRENILVKLKTPNGYFLCASGDFEPWNFSVIHARNKSEINSKWFLWKIWDFSHSKCNVDPLPKLKKKESTQVKKTPQGRMVHYVIADANGYVGEHAQEGSFAHNGKRKRYLIRRLKNHSGCHNFTLHTRDSDGNLIPIDLRPPLGTDPIHLVVVPTE